jgi:hypothetical protein
MLDGTMPLNPRKGKPHSCQDNYREQAVVAMFSEHRHRIQKAAFKRSAWLERVRGLAAVMVVVATAGAITAV